MSKLTELQTIIQDIEDCGSSHHEAVCIVGEALDRSTATVYGWLNKSQLTPIPNHLLTVLKQKLENNK